MSREITNKLHEEVDEGILTWEIIARAALRYMSEDQVAEMAEMAELLCDEE